jgi:hypothetical protein
VIHSRLLCKGLLVNKKKRQRSLTKLKKGVENKQRVKTDTSIHYQDKEYNQQCPNHSRKCSEGRECIEWMLY